MAATVDILIHKRGTVSSSTAFENKYLRRALREVK
jgi:hypothetical protein